MTSGDPATRPYEPDYAIPPGETLAEVLGERGMSQAELARRTGISTKHVNQIIGGSASITADTALKLERVTKIPARFWANLEADYQVQLSRQGEATELEHDLDWLRHFPVAELQKRGYIAKRASAVDQLREILVFYGVANREAWRTIWDVPTAYRKSRAFDSDLHALSAWLRIGELRASEMECAAFDRSRFREMLTDIRGLTRQVHPQQWLPKLEEACKQAGVAVVVEKEITGARINGAARWINPEKALIQLSLRHRWADIFWFTFFHEAGHLLLHDRKKLTFIDIGSDDDDLENEADDFAGRTLIPREYAKDLPFLRTSTEIQDFAERLNLGSGIVVGRLQHDGFVGHDQLNSLRHRFQFTDDR